MATTVDRSITEVRHTSLGARTAALRSCSSLGTRREIKAARERAVARCPGGSGPCQRSAYQWITNPLEGIRRKKDSSMVRAIELVREDQADAIISPGNTGGALVAGSMKLRA